VVVTVLNPAPGGGEAVALGFKIISDAPGTPQVPVITLLNPAVVTAGSGDTILEITGSGFNENSQVYYNGQFRPTNFISASQMQGLLAAQDIQQPGIGIVQIYNPGVAGQSSGEFSAYKVLKILPINVSTPAILATEPVTVSLGGPAFSLQVYGNNFTADSVVRWNGSIRTTLYLSSTLLLADIGSADIAGSTPLTATITVLTPGSANIPLLSNPSYVRAVEGCQPYLVTILTDGNACGTLRAAIGYVGVTAGASGSPTKVGFAVLRGSQFTLDSSLTLTKSVSVSLPCGQYNQPQYGVTIAGNLSNSTAGISLGDSNILVKLAGFSLRGNGSPLLKVSSGQLQGYCLKVTKS
jgi:hypothetical protein